ncbi:MAG TPA: hypothetical protein VM925_17030, partial [Labilithrix sp.]|nr:hypothetical protein [Labilithrix sp.]
MIAMRARAVPFFFLVLVASAPARAEAPAQGYPPCVKTVTTNDSELAHQKYIAGRQDYEEGNYDSAVRRFRDAYNLDCTKHELLVILAAAHERKGDKREAVSALETYVERASSAPDVATYKAKIENLKKQIAETASPPPSPPSGSPREHTVFPWIVAAAGGVALGAGIVLLATAPALPSGCDAETRTCLPRTGEAPVDLEQRKRDAGKSADQPTWGTVVT